MANIFTRFLGTKNSRELKRMGKIVGQINALEDQFDADTDLPAYTEQLKERLSKIHRVEPG